YLIQTGDSYEFKLGDDLSASPLAERLLNFPFVTAVFISNNFVSISKIEQLEWDDILDQMRTFIADFLNNGGSVLRTKLSPQIKEQQSTTLAPKKELTAIEAKITDILEQYVK